MNRSIGGALALLLVGSLVATAQPVRPAPAVGKLEARVAALAGVDVKTARKVLAALGPAMGDTIRAGQRVELAGVGALEIVRIQESERRIGDRPVFVPARNYVELKVDPVLDVASNSPGAVHDRLVPQVKFEPARDAVEGARVPSGTFKTPRSRTP